MPAVFLAVMSGFGGPKDASAQVKVNLSFSLGVALPQEVVMVPGGVYFVPGQDADVFFYSGFWWAARDSQWYRANDYNGTWIVMDQRYVPAPVHRIYLVPNYRAVYGKQEGKRIPYGQWKKNGYKGSAQEKSGNPAAHGTQGAVQENYKGSEDQGKQVKQKGKSGKENKKGHGK